jgi:ATP-dependent protease ClpP protease subunit
MRNWYRVDAAAAGKKDVADIYIYDEIGKSFWNDDALTASKFIADLKALPESVKTIRVHVNSPGGNVFEASAIANALRAERTDHGRTVEMRIDGIAASAATIVTSAGNPIRIADNAMMMIHEPSGIGMGPSSSLRKLADALDAIRSAIVAAYRWVSTKTEDELIAMMAATTWMTAKEAVENGFATEVIKGSEVTACFRPDVLAALGEIPVSCRQHVNALIKYPAEPETPPVPAAAADVLRLCREAECLDLAEGLVEAKATLEEARTRIATERQTRTQAQARATQIRALCGRAKLPELTDGYIQGAMPLEAIRAQLTVLTAKLDRIEIDGSLPADQGARTPVRIDTAAIYAARNRPLTTKE